MPYYSCWRKFDLPQMCEGLACWTDSRPAQGYSKVLNIEIKARSKAIGQYRAEFSNQLL